MSEEFIGKEQDLDRRTHRLIAEKALENIFLKGADIQVEAGLKQAIADKDPDKIQELADRSLEMMRTKQKIGRSADQALKAGWS